MIWVSAKDKSPGPDGITFTFFKECWEILKSYILNFVNEFHSNARLPKGITTSFLALISKFGNPQNIEEYIPICLIGSLYKILSKLLASRIKKVVNLLVSLSQSTFIS